MTTKLIARTVATVAILGIVLLVGTGGVSGAEPEPCVGPGWAPGDVWGPGPEDIVPNLPPCEPDPECPDLLPGWHVGDKWGPGEFDVVTCDTDVEALRLPRVFTAPVVEAPAVEAPAPLPELTPPPTDT